MIPSFAFEIVQVKSIDTLEILALQQLAFQTEADLYQDFGIPPLTQSRASLEQEIISQTFLKAVVNNRIVGSVRAEFKEDTCYINRLMVHPNYRRQGIGTRLMQAIEGRFSAAKRFQLGTGHKSEANIRMYRKMGYQEVERKPLNENVTFVIMRKKIRD